MIGIDTNILVYAFDNAYPEKQKVCSDVINKVFSGQLPAAITNQVLAEFARVVAHKIQKPLSAEDAVSIIIAIQSSDNWKKLAYDAEDIVFALRSGGNFWDSLLASTFIKNGVQEIITENSDDFGKSGLFVKNPFVKHAIAPKNPAKQKII